MIRNVTKPLHHRVLDYLIGNKESFAVTQPARYLLFEGYTDRTFEHVPFLPQIVEKFGWFLNENASTDGVLGVSSKSQLTKWKWRDGSTIFQASALGEPYLTGSSIFHFEPKYRR